MADEAAAKKVAALLAHRSQWRSTMKIEPHAPEAEQTSQREAFVRRINEELVGDTTDARAERFKRIDDL